MKRILLTLIIIFSIFSPFNLSAQENKTDEQKRHALEDFRKKRVEYITQEVGLTTEEGKEFWPICNELEEKRFILNRNLRQETRKLRESKKNGKQISDFEYENLINLNLENRAKELELDKEYIKKIKKILSPEKVYKYQQAEQRFAKDMIMSQTKNKVKRF